MACRRVTEQECLMDQEVDDFVLQAYNKPTSRFCFSQEHLALRDPDETLCDVAQLVDRLVARTSDTPLSPGDQPFTRQPMMQQASTSSPLSRHLGRRMRTVPTDAQHVLTKSRSAPKLQQHMDCKKVAQGSTQPFLASAKMGPISDHSLELLSNWVQQYQECERVLRVPFELTSKPFKAETADVLYKQWREAEAAAEVAATKAEAYWRETSPKAPFEVTAQPFQTEARPLLPVESSTAQSSTQPALPTSKTVPSRQQPHLRRLDGGPARQVLAKGTGVPPNGADRQSAAEDFSRWRPRRTQMVSAGDFQDGFQARRSSGPKLQKLGSFTISDKAGPWYGAFQKLKVEGQVHRDQLIRALELGGIEVPNVEWLDQALQNVGVQYATLDFDEFCSIIEGYKELQLQDARAMFHMFDEDGSGTIEPTELAMLLSNLNIKPMRHVVAEILKEVDEDNTGNLDFEEFQQVVKHIKDREGFANTEYFRIKRTFRDHDNDHSGTLDVSELFNSMRSMGYSLSQQDVVSIVAQVDPEGEGRSLSEHMVLRCMRLAREIEMERMVKALPKLRRLSTQFITWGGGDTDMRLDAEDVLSVLHALGQVPITRVVQEVAEDIGLPLPNRFGLGEIWKFLEIYREREGLSKADMENIELTFGKFDHRRRHTIDTRDVTAALAELGHTVDGWSHDLVMTFVAQVNHGEAKVTYFQFKQVVRKFREWEIRRAQRLFDSLVPQGESILGLGIAQAALREFAVSASEVFEEDEALALQPLMWERSAGIGGESISREEDASRGLTRLAFVRAALQRSADCERLVRKYHGFNLREVARLREKFAGFDRKGYGRVGHYYLAKLCMDMFPSLATSQHMRPELLKACRESDNEFEPGLELDFDGFLQLMFRHHQNMVEARAGKEQLVVSNSNIKLAEVNKFRDIFVSEDEALNGYLTFETISTILTRRCGCVLGGKRMAEMRKVFKEVVSEKSEIEYAREADFPDFLRLMVKLSDMDFANIRCEPPQSLTQAESSILLRRPTVCIIRGVTFQDPKT